MNHNGAMRTNRNRIEFDGAVVRRHPLTSWDRADLANIALRHEMARDLGLPVPRVLAVHSDHLVLERAAGTPLMETPLSEAAEARLGAALADVLRILATVTDWPLDGTPWHRLWERLHSSAGVESTARAALLARSITPTLTHGDLSGGNLLVSPNGDLCAVIDWDGATLADHAQDFRALCENVPAGVAQSIWRHTEQAEVLQSRADVYLATWAVQDQLWRQGQHPWITSDDCQASPKGEGEGFSGC